MSELQFGRVAVLGAGTMGSGIAQVCAQAGSEVVLQDIEQGLLERGLEDIRSFLAKGVAKGKVTEEESTAALGRIRGTLDLADAVGPADLVFEAAPEKLDLKVGIFEAVAAACREETVLASNTSSLSLADVFATVPHPERCCGMHFFNPPPLMKLLELIRPDAVDLPVMKRVVAYAKELGKEPILVKDSPGFATSRLGVVLGLEAIRMVQAGVAAPEDIDKAMELGYRHPMGPLRLTDLVGLDVRMAIADYLRRRLDSPAFEVPDLMREMVAAGKLGRKTGQGFYPWK